MSTPSSTNTSPPSGAESPSTTSDGGSSAATSGDDVKSDGSTQAVAMTSAPSTTPDPTPHCTHRRSTAAHVLDVARAEPLADERLRGDRERVEREPEREVDA